MMRKIFLSIIVILTSFYAVAVVHAQDGAPIVPTDDDVNAIAKQLYCPVCPNTPLDVCETQACKDWRKQIRNQLTDGWSEQEIIDYFVEQYGERVLAEPQRSGFSTLVWILPLLSVVLGLVVIWQVLKSWQTTRLDQNIHPPSTHYIPPEILKKIENDLRELD
jgi:cytochrome c-type biogenesis protein CcmH